MNKALIVILSAVLLDAIGIGLIFPILPGLLREVTQITEIAPLYGVMIALYALMQFIFSPILGALSDRIGRRPVLLLSLAGAALDYVVMALTPFLWVLLVGRAIAGITSANMAVATAYLTDITPAKQRAQRFGYLHAMFGIGFIIGPVLGGVLGEYWLRAPFLAAALFNFMNFLLAWFVLPESRKGKAQKWDWQALNPIQPLRWALGIKALLPFMLIFFILNFIGQVYGTVWVLYGEDQLNWTPIVVGLSLAAFGLFHAGAQAFLPGPAVRWFGERNAIIIGFVAELTALAFLAFVTDGWVAFMLLPLFALGGIGLPALQSITTQTVDEDHQGRLQGMLTSLTSLSAVFGPLVFSAIYFSSTGLWPGLVWIVAAGLYLLVIPMVWRTRGISSTVK